ncbi:Pepco domain-containing protein [Frankia tisae]|uniref:Pepco domain-containing protein n=1 Tax=Frankia tisae TaxID=2950104 RepID=UPI0021BFCB17|nr:hypothetical protein [Frankia tisae]
MSRTSSEIQIDTLPFLVVDENEGAAGEKGIFGRRGDEASVRHIPLTVLRDNLRQVVAGLQELFDDVAGSGARLPLKQAQVSFEVTASGGVTVLGASGQLGATGGIVLTFGE